MSEQDSDTSDGAQMGRTYRRRVLQAIGGLGVVGVAGVQPGVAQKSSNEVPSQSRVNEKQSHNDRTRLEQLVINDGVIAERNRALRRRNTVGNGGSAGRDYQPRTGLHPIGVDTINPADDRIVTSDSFNGTPLYVSRLPIWNFAPEFSQHYVSATGYFRDFEMDQALDIRIELEGFQKNNPPHQITETYHNPANDFMTQMVELTPDISQYGPFAMVNVRVSARLYDGKGANVAIAPGMTIMYWGES